MRRPCATPALMNISPNSAVEEAVMGETAGADVIVAKGFEA